MGQQSGWPVSWALGLQGFGLKGELHLLFEIEPVCVLNHNKFFGITMLFEFVFLHFEYNFEIIFASSGAFVVYDHAVAFCAMFVDELVVAGYIVPSDGFASA